MKRYGVKLVTAAAFASCALAVVAQTSAPQPDMLQQQMQQKIQQMQQATARNEQQLHTYQWIESTTLTIDGKAMPAKQLTCRYATDGTLLKTPVGSQEQQQMPGGPLMKHIVEKKKEKIQEEVEEIQAVMKMYLPIDKAKLKEVLRAGTIGLERDGANVNTVVLNNYAKQGDQVRLTLNRSTMQVDRVEIKTYFESPDDAMTVDVLFSALSEGTVYPAQTSIQAPSKKLNITTAESDFVKPAY
jgi:hypothetical protein